MERYVVIPMFLAMFSLIELREVGKSSCKIDNLLEP